MTAEYNGLTFSRPGHATVRIETTDGTVIYLDPWSEVISGEPGDGSLILTSHDDMDHYDPAAISAVAADNATVVAYQEIDTAALDTEVISLDVGEDVTVQGVSITGVPAYNKPDGSHVKGDGEPYHPEGTVLGFVITVDDVTIYYPSDTDVLDELEGIDADVVLPPIGGSYTMDRHEALDLIEAIDPELVLPVHYNSEDIGGLETDEEAFKEEVEELGPRVTLF